MPQSALHTPPSLGSPWLSRALVVSAVAHVIGVIVLSVAVKPASTPKSETVDIELAPAPPKAEALPAEQAKPLEAETPGGEQPTAAATQPTQDEATYVGDAGVDAPIDASIDAPADARRRRPDAAPDAPPDAEVPLVAIVDAGDDASVDDGAVESVAALGSGAESGSGVGSGTGSGSDLLGSGAGSIASTGSGVPGAETVGSGSGAPGMTDEPAVEGEPTTAGTAANLLAYFPPGHVITALIRFDRLRDTEWAAYTERLLRPLPDYQILFGDQTIALSEKLDTLVISSPRPKDATATTLVGKTAMKRPEMRTFLENPKTPIAWSTVRGGMLGKRSGRLFQNDKRLLLSPWQSWFVLAQPGDLGTLTAKATGDLDTITATGKLPGWLHTLRTIEKESGEEKRGPALVVTFAAGGKPYEIPDIGLGITSLPAPERLSLAMELVKQGWLLRGNIKFASEADAKTFVKNIEDAKQRIEDSTALSLVLKKQHLLNVIQGLSLARTGARVSYGTSLSIADARALLAAAAVTLDDYFKH